MRARVLVCGSSERERKKKYFLYNIWKNVNTRWAERYRREKYVNCGLREEMSDTSHYPHFPSFIKSCTCTNYSKL